MTLKKVPANSMHYIQRIDKRHIGWKVAFRRKSREWHKYFSDAAYGGKRQALSAAKLWRNEWFAKLSGIDYKVWRRELVPPSNTTGIVGVHRGVMRKMSGGKVVDWVNWQAYWRDADGRRKTKSFSVNKYGEEEAKALAKRARQEGMKEFARQLKARSIDTANPIGRRRSR